MNTVELKNELIDRLCADVHTFLAASASEVPEAPLQAFALFCDSGCVSVGGALSSAAALQRRQAAASNDRARVLAAVHVIEWEHVNRHREAFTSSNAYIDEIFRILEEETLDDVDLDALDGEAEWDFTYGLFIDAFSQALLRLKAEGCFGPPRFDGDVLLGALFSDPGQYDRRVIEGVSRRVNSPAWHRVVEQFVGYARA